MKTYFECLGEDLFKYLPLTFHIQEGSNDPQFDLFNKRFEEFQNDTTSKKKFQNVWIVKPGENTNRGNGINV